MNLPETPRTKVEFTVSTATLLKIMGVLMGLWFLYFIHDIIAMVFVALILSALITPLADWCEARKIPRAVGVVMVYVVLFSVTGLVIGVLIPPLIQEIRDLASNFGSVWDRLVSGVLVFRQYSQESGFSKNVEQGLAAIQTGLAQAVGGVFTTLTSIFGGLFSLVLILVLTFYMVMQQDSMRKIFNVLVPERYQSFAGSLLGKIQKKITAWMKGQAVLSLSVGMIVYVGLAIVGVNYALVLGLFAALTEFVPYAGPFLAAVVAIFFALSESLTKAFFVVLLFIVIQQLENNILVPKVMQRAVGLNPIISILALVIGVKLGGITGALFAIPVATAIDVIIREVLQGGARK